MSDGLSGGCLCGAVRYRTTALPMEVQHCHCTMCQKASGAPFQTYLDFYTAQVEWTGEAPASYQSSEIARRGFCPRCGTPLSFQYLKHPDRLALTIGSLDDPAAVTPQRHDWYDRHVGWLNMDDGLPRYRHDGERIDDAG